MDRTTSHGEICLIYDFLSEQGGLERELITHARFLQQAGYTVTILTCHLDPQLLTLLPFEDIPVKTIGLVNAPWEIVNLGLCFLGINRLSSWNPDLFISYSFPANYLLRNKKTIKINYVNHYPHFLYHSPEEQAEWAAGTHGVKRKLSVWVGKFLGSYLKKLDRKLLLQNKLLFMNSKFTQKNLEKLYAIKGTVVSYPPLDKRFSSPQPGTIREKFIFSSSRIIPDKKYELLLDAGAHLKKKLPIWLAGSVQPNYKAQLEAYARKRKVTLTFLGRLKTDEIINHYASAQVFAFPTPGEDFGLVPAESLACGTPVVAWGDGAGPTEQIMDGVNGYLAQPLDVKDFARKIDLIINSDMKKKKGKQIQASAKPFLFDSLQKEFVTQVQKVIRNNSRS